MAKRRILDSEGVAVKAGDTLRFSYGIPPNVVTAPVIERDGALIALCEGHRPNECPVSALKRHVGYFRVLQ